MYNEILNIILQVIIFILSIMFIVICALIFKLVDTIKESNDINERIKK